VLVSSRVRLEITSGLEGATTVVEPLAPEASDCNFLSTGRRDGREAKDCHSELVAAVRVDYDPPMECDVPEEHELARLPVPSAL
jgi:hypothetical protein